MPTLANDVANMMAIGGRSGLVATVAIADQQWLGLLVENQELSHVADAA
jgi:hypothetical protein